MGAALKRKRRRRRGGSGAAARPIRRSGSGSTSPPERSFRACAGVGGGRGDRRIAPEAAAAVCASAGSAQQARRTFSCGGSSATGRYKKGRVEMADSGDGACSKRADCRAYCTCWPTIARLPAAGESELLRGACAGWRRIVSIARREAALVSLLLSALTHRLHPRRCWRSGVYISFPHFRISAISRREGSITLGRRGGLRGADGPRLAAAGGDAGRRARQGCWRARSRACWR